jgi:hypothetical protein
MGGGAQVEENGAKTVEKLDGRTVPEGIAGVIFP